VAERNATSVTGRLEPPACSRADDKLCFFHVEAVDARQRERASGLRRFRAELSLFSRFDGEWVFEAVA